MATIDRFEFNNDALVEIRSLKHYNTMVGENWPVVYVLSNDKDAYVGETVNVARRTEQHLGNSAKQKLTEIRIITDKDFNKSVVLDLESYLIKHMAADGKYSLLNGNNGIQDHDYYERSAYEDKFRLIWNKLRKLGVVNKSIEDIENSELYKYSPYKSLGSEQFHTEMEILQALEQYRHSENGARIIVTGGAGTGKTILAIYLIKLFADINSKGETEPDADDYLDEDMEVVYAAERIDGIEKIGIVFPQKSLRSSLKDVFRGIKSLDPDMVLDTTDVVSNYLKTGEKYDLLIVDEAHRLKCRNKGHLSFYGRFDKCNKDLGLDKMTGTELDWIYKCSRNQIIFRDDLQTIRPCDIDAADFREITDTRYPGTVIRQALSTQWRCLGGNGYIDYLREIMSGTAKKYRKVENYDFKLYDDPGKMHEDIKALNDEYGLCRMAAGYAWKWVTKKDKKAYDIIIGKNKFRWNSTYDNWITSKNAVNEI
jgi:predicted GIY-YIG superfamily endonuclease